MTTLTFKPLVVIGDGFQPDEPAQIEYLRRFYTPILGPSTVLLIAELERRSGGHHIVSVDAAELAGDLGLGGGTSRHSRFGRTLLRAEQFRFLIARSDEPALWLLPTLVPLLSNSRLNRLRPELIIEERAFLAMHRPHDEPAA